MICLDFHRVLRARQHRYASHRAKSTRPMRYRSSIILSVQRFGGFVGRIRGDLSSFDERASDGKDQAL